MNDVQTQPVDDAFVVQISAKLKQRLDLYIGLCPFEISGLGEVEVDDGVLVVTALHLLEQEGSPGETTLSAEDQLKFMTAATEKGVDLAKVKLWWHSHAMHESYWSPTDEQTIESTGQPPWWLSIVGNHRGVYLARLDIFPNGDLPMRLTAHGTLEVVHDQREVNAVSKEIKKKVKEKRRSTPLSAILGAGYGDLGSLALLGERE